MSKLQSSKPAPVIAVSKDIKVQRKYLQLGNCDKFYFTFEFEYGM
jgi:hypothetical protein